MAEPKFHIHTNRELGKKYYEKREYYADMKKLGLEPYNPNKIKKVERKPYEQSSWAKDMLRDVANRKGRAPGDRFMNELSKRGMNQTRYEQAQKLAKEMR